MLLVIYNSNPIGCPEINPARGWLLYSESEWLALKESAAVHFSFDNAEPLVFMPPDCDPVYYTSYDEWLADYQVSVVLYNFAAYIDNQQLDFVLGTDFFEPCFLQDDDEPIYPEMDLD